MRWHTAQRQERQQRQEVQERQAGGAEDPGASIHSTGGRGGKWLSDVRWRLCVGLESYGV